MLELFLRVIESTKEGLSGFPANASNKNIEAATGSVRNGVPQKSQENTCARVSFLIKLQAKAEACNFIKKRLRHRSFSANFGKFLRTVFLQNNSGRRLLNNIQMVVFNLLKLPSEKLNQALT